MTNRDLIDFKSYIGSFEYDLIIASTNRIAVINQTKRQYIECSNRIMVIDMLEYLISNNDSLTDIFSCNNVYFSTDDYLLNYLSDCQQIC